MLAALQCNKGIKKISVLLSLVKQERSSFANDLTLRCNHQTLVKLKRKSASWEKEIGDLPRKLVKRNVCLRLKGKCKN